MKRGVKQGSPLSPSLFAIVVDHCMEELVQKWKDDDTGFSYGWQNIEAEKLSENWKKDVLSEMTFADDMTLLASDPSQLQSMVTEISLKLREVGLQLSVEKCEWLSTDDTDIFEEITIVNTDGKIEKMKHVKEFLLLGSKITETNDVTAEVLNRIQKGWRYFWAHKSIFCNKYAKLAGRLHVWSFTVQKCVMWCLETLPMNDKHLKMLDDMQISMIGTMLRLKRRWIDGESWLDWAKRRIRTAKYFIEFYSPGFLSQYWLGAYWNWAGHVARLHEERRAFQLTRNWCLQWKREGLASHRGLNVYDKLHQWKLRGSGRAYDMIWEKRLDEFCIAQDWNWWVMAQDRETWNQWRWHFVRHYQGWWCNGLATSRFENQFDEFGRWECCQTTPWTGQDLWLQAISSEVG